MSRFIRTHRTSGRICDTLSDLGPMPDSDDESIHIYRGACHTYDGDVMEVVMAICAPLGLRGIHVISRLLSEAPGSWSMEKGGSRLNSEVADALAAEIGERPPGPFGEVL